ncbi:ABC transporter ATP-binding protein [Wolbachia endosymbiont of Chironomus riparius]|uniref:ABC transporter ATP-binding protein n=1 Tax=Wolbachia endosymbiont of Chironomus riparius TaxID=2883238 RepID=UPI00209DC9D8|nr:ABC transporter ATP-binding protein [Wolbachia endosymbiont of Chironomus riparius]
MNINITAKQVLYFILKTLSPFLLHISIVLLAGLIWAIETSFSPYLVKIIIDRASTSAANDLFHNVTTPAISYVSILFLLECSCRVYSYFFEIKMIPRLRKNIAESSLARLLYQDHSYYQNQFSGSLANKINDLIHCIPEVVQIVIDKFFTRMFMLGIAIYFLWQINIYFPLLMLSWTSLFVLFSFFVAKKITNLADVWSELHSVITGKMVDIFSNIISVKLFANKSWEKTFFKSICNETVKAEEKLQWLYMWIFTFYGFLFLIMQILNLYFLIEGRKHEIITIGDFAFVMSINITIANFMWEISKDFSQFSKSWGKITQALRTISSIPKIQDKTNAAELIVKEGKITFDKVCFQYDSKETIFQNQSLVINPGQKVGIVGYSGAGKSTFVNLILRLYDVTSGNILIDGQDVRDVTQYSLHKKVGIILQDPSLFHRTLMENIRYGKVDASDNEVVDAARRAHAHEFIMKFSQGYDSLIGERGIKLSGGQRQRIAIARTILKNAPILIMDEATSQLDSITESDIQESLWKLMQNKTTIVIAHRLSTLLNMDRILVFEEGKIVEDGTHKELLSKNGLYKTLWDAQISGFLPNKKQ